MKKLTKGVYYYWGQSGAKRLWHDCDKYKGDERRRVELDPGDTSEDWTYYNCDHCNFEYILDENLQLVKSRV